MFFLSLIAIASSSAQNVRIARFSRVLQSVAPIRPAMVHTLQAHENDETESNCTASLLKKFASPDEDEQSLCESACRNIDRRVEINEWEKTNDGTDRRRVCVCSPIDESEKEHENTDDDGKSRPCAVAGLRPASEDAMQECACPSSFLTRAQLLLLALYGLFVLGVGCCMLVQCFFQTCICLVGCTRPVKDEDDIHWARCCCKAGGAFCCIPAATLPAVRTTTPILYGAILVELTTAFFGFPGLGICLLGFLSKQAPAEHRNKYYVVGIMYVVATFMVGLLYSTFVFAVVAIGLQVFVSYCYICTLSALIRLPCKQGYAQRWLSGNASVMDSREEPVPFAAVAAEPLIVADASLNKC
jgi:hypothetical protein